VLGETKNQAEAASNSAGNRYFRKDDKRGFRMTRPQFAQPPNVDESRDPLVPTRMTPEFWGNICLQKEATQEEIRGLPGQIKSDLRSEQKWLLLAQWDPFCCRPPLPCDHFATYAVAFGAKARLRPRVG
jgi:hypothetical protein